MRLFLRHAVQIEPDVDPGVAPRNALPQAPIELRQCRRLFRMCAFFRQSLTGRRRFTRGLIGCSARRSTGAAAQWRHPARKSSPQRSFVVAHAAPAHRRRRALDLLFADGAAFAPAAFAGLVSGNGASSAAPSGAVGSGILS
jgi:hypothetical protein